MGMVPLGLGLGKIALRLRRSKQTVSEHVFAKNTVPKVMGRPCDIDDKLFTKILAKYEVMLAKLSRASGPKEVTIKMLIKAMNLDVCEKTVSRAFWKRKVRHVSPHDDVRLSGHVMCER